MLTTTPQLPPPYLLKAIHGKGSCLGVGGSDVRPTFKTHSILQISHENQILSGNCKKGPGKLYYQVKNSVSRACS